MATIMPFRSVRPKAEHAVQVAAPPYDVVSLDEARNVAEGNPYCFLRVGRAELELADGVDPYSTEVYERGAANLRKFLGDNILVREPYPMLGRVSPTLGDPRTDRSRRARLDRRIRPWTHQET